jgi:RNA polymerase sigma-70 factor (ECF subfamily)
LAEDSDETLVARYRRGDVAAFEALLDRHGLGVHRFLMRLLQDRARADDLAQECWLRFIGAVPRWNEERGRLKPWLYTVARNLAADDARRGAHRRQESGMGTDRGEPSMLDPPRSARSPEDAVADGQLRSALEGAIASLPPEQREVFLLREYEGVPFADIAEITGAPVPTVKSRMRYALEALRRSLSALEVGAMGSATARGLRP